MNSIDTRLRELLVSKKTKIQFDTPLNIQFSSMELVDILLSIETSFEIELNYQDFESGFMKGYNLTLQIVEKKIQSKL
jgi:acyl carrier protein